MLTGPIGAEALMIRGAREFECTTAKLLDVLETIDGGHPVEAYITTDVVRRGGVRKISIASCTLNSPAPGRLAFGRRMAPGGSLVVTRRGVNLQVWDYTEYSNVYIGTDGRPVPLTVGRSIDRESPFDTRMFSLRSIRKIQIGVNVYNVKP